MTTGTPATTGGMRLGVDFGAGIIVIAAGGPGVNVRTLEFPDLSREYPGAGVTCPVHGVPSLVTYADGKVAGAGSSVLRQGAEDHPATARWLRRYLLENSPVQIPAGCGRMVKYGEAAADLLIPLLSRALGRYPGAALVFAVPPKAPAVFSDFLHRAAREAGAVSCAFMTEAEAAAFGYGCVMAPGDPYVFITLDGTGLDVAVLSAEDRPAGPGCDGIRTIAQASASISCRAIDTWIMQDMFRKFRLLESDPRAERLAPQVRCEAARVREQLPVTGNAEVRLSDRLSGRVFSASYTGADLDACLAELGVIGSLEECIGRALSALRLRGMDERMIKAVLLLGPGCAMPAIEGAVRSRFEGIAVHAGHPLDAIARGAALYSAPARAPDRISSSYALRYWDPSVQEHHYRFIVQSGTRYPSAGQVARVIISAAYDGQTHLGIPLYEIGGAGCGTAPLLELVSDTGGGVRFAGPAQDAEIGGHAVHANERSPTLLVATPPARKGEPRFECTFTIDAERNLCLSARDLVTGSLVKLNAPVHRLN